MGIPGTAVEIPFGIAEIRWKNTLYKNRRKPP